MMQNFFFGHKTIALLRNILYHDENDYDCDDAVELTSESAPRSTPGQTKVTNSWHLLWTTKLQTGGKSNNFLSLLSFFILTKVQNVKYYTASPS